MKTINILILNGPNLNLTGIREPEHYGTEPLKNLNDLQGTLQATFPGLRITLFQSNHEGELIDMIQHAKDDGKIGIVINPGGFTHTSVSIADALKTSGLPVVEVHLSNIYAREEFRRHNIIAPVCRGSISGLGLTGYRLALVYLAGEMIG